MAERLSIERCTELLAYAERLHRGRYVHLKTGEHYEATTFALRESDLVVEVVYRPLSAPSVAFTRPLVEFIARFEKQRQTG